MTQVTNIAISRKANVRYVGKWPKYKLWTALGLFLFLLFAWFALGIYLHMELSQSRAKVEQARLEAQRREERLRRGARYQQDLQQRTQAPQTRNAFDGR